MARTFKNNSCLNNQQVDTARLRILRKSLCNIPNKFADEMIFREWILRNEIIWHKPACIPSSVHDRFTVDLKRYFSLPKTAVITFNSNSNLMPLQRSSVIRGPII